MTRMGVLLVAGTMAFAATACWADEPVESAPAVTTGTSVIVETVDPAHAENGVIVETDAECGSAGWAHRFQPSGDCAAEALGLDDLLPADLSPRVQHLHPHLRPDLRSAPLHLLPVVWREQLRRSLWPRAVRRGDNGRESAGPLKRAGMRVAFPSLGKYLTSSRRRSAMASTTDKAKDKIDETAEKARQKGHQMADKAKDAAKSAGQKMKDVGQKITDKA